MTHWDVVLIIGALLAIGTTIMIPILKLNTTITKLGCSVDTLNIEVSNINRKVDVMTDTVSKHGDAINKSRVEIKNLKGN